jgi:hypothetical protein
MNQKTEIIIAGILFILLTVGIGGAYVWTNRTSTDTIQDYSSDSSSSANDAVAVLGQTDTFSRQVTEPEPGAVEEPAAQTEPSTLPTQPYTLLLPAGWAQTDSKTELSPCGDGKQWKTDTYVNGAETLTVYENGHPGGCDKAIVVDTYLDFNFNADNTGLAVDTSIIKQCAKTENPACPVGDGVVDMLIGNASAADPSVAEPNSKNKNTYFFRLVDTKIDQNQFDAQVKGLAALVEAIKF